MPQTLQEYFEARVANKPEEDSDLARAALERIRADKEDRKARQKELKARIFAGKISSSQFGEYLKQPADDPITKKELEEIEAEQTKLDMRDQIRNSEELGESYRRRMVASGAWTEAESRQKLKDMYAENEKRHPTKREEERASINFYKQQVALAQIKNSKSMHEREYYFDEGLGISLEEHVDGLKKQFPDINIDTLRDRDGYAIVRMTLKPQYKFDYDEIKSLDAAALHKANLEAQEAILEVFMPDDKKAFVQAVAAIHMNRVTDGLTQDGIEELRCLKRERLVGKFREDHAGYKKALEELKRTAAIGNISPTKLCIFSLD